MNASGASGGAAAVWATVRREWLSHRVNRFMHWHLGLLALAGVAAVLTAPPDEVGGVAWFVLYAVLYVISLSSLLLGLSSAQAEVDETPFLLTQPTGMSPWILGKALGLVAIVAPSAILLIVPWLVTSGWSAALALLAVASAGLSALLALGGLAIGLWIRDPVRGLITAVAAWFVGLFATDLLLILVAGSPWIHAHPVVWVAPLMLNPFDALRVTVLLELEQSAFNTLGSDALVQWWTAHSGSWLAGCLLGWGVLAGVLALIGARQRRMA